MSDIKRLAEVIAFSVKTKNKTPEEVAALCMCPAGLVAAWLEGRAVPDRQRWGFLCSRLDRALFTYGSLHSAALAELAGRPVATTAPQTSVGAGVLGERIREALKPLMGSPAGPLVDPGVRLGPPAPAAEAPRVADESRPGVVDDVRAIRADRTSKALLALPSGWRSRENINKRENFARNFFRAKPHANLAACAEALEKEFGVGIGSTSLSRIRDEERRMLETGQRPVTQVRDVSNEPLSTEPTRDEVIDMPRTGQGNAELLASVAPPAPTVDDQLQVAIEIVLEAVPHLAEMTITRNASGEVAYKVVEAKVVETTGRVVRPK